MVLGILSTRRLKRFKKNFSKLDPQIQKAVEKAIAELYERAEAPRGRRLEKTGGRPGLWKLRVNDNYRLTFSIEGTQATLENVDTHRIYDNL